MSRVHRAVWALGLALAAGLAPLCPPHSVAQTVSNSGIGGRPWLAPDARRAVPRSTAPSEDAAVLDFPAHQPPTAELPGSDEDQNEEDGARPAIARQPIVDGRMGWPAADVDGRIEVDDPEPSLGPAAAVVHDARGESDRAAFERPPAGFDPRAFSIEPEPLLDRRPAQLFRFEPYEPLGIRVGSFILFPVAELGLAVFDNVFRTSGHPRRDIALEVRPGVRAVSDWSAHAVELRAEGIGTFHDDFPSEDDRGALIEARGRLDITRRTNIEALAAWELVPEARGSINAPIVAGERAEIGIVRAAASLNHRFNRLSVQFRGSIAEYDYSPQSSDLAVAADDDRDYLQKEAAIRTSWLFKPNLSAFGEIAINTRDYGPATSDGIERDSAGERYRLGVSFGSNDAILRGEASIGYGRQHFDAAGLPQIEGILLDANLAWRANALTSLLLRARTDITEAILAGSGGALSHMAGLELRHAFLRQLIGSAGARFTWLDYEGVVLREQELVGLLGLEYYLNREVTLFGRYEHIAFESSEPGRNFNADEVRIGVRVRR